MQNIVVYGQALSKIDRWSNLNVKTPFKKNVYKTKQDRWWIICFPNVYTVQKNNPQSLLIVIRCKRFGPHGKGATFFFFFFNHSISVSTIKEHDE